jgi:hypothetical protein
MGFGSVGLAKLPYPASPRNLVHKVCCAKMLLKDILWI